MHAIAQTSKKCKLYQALFASTVFATLPMLANAGLVPVVINTNSGLLPDLGQGYEFVLPNLTLTILDADHIGSSAIPLLGLNGSVDVAAILGGNETLNFAGGSTVAAAVGPSNPIQTINLQGANKTVNFNGNITAVTTNFTKNGIANLADGVVVTGIVDNIAAAGTGTLTLLGSGQVTGNIGPTAAILALNVNANGGAGKIVELDGGVINAQTIFVNDDGTGASANATTLKLNNAAMLLTGNITTNTNNENILDVSNANVITGNIGSLGHAFYLVNIGLHNNTNVVGNIFAATTLFQGNNALILNDGHTITGAIDSTALGAGALEFKGAGLVTGNIGKLNAIASLLINSSGGVGKTVELDGAIININSTTIANSSKATTLLLNSPTTMQFTGNITTGNNGIDTLDIANAAATTIIGNIGGAGNLFNLVKVAQNADSTISGNISAVSTQFQGNHILSLTDGSGVTGAVNTVVADQGVLRFQGNGRVTGNISDLSLIEANTLGSANKIIELNGAIIDSPINIVGGNVNPTTLLFNSPAGTAVTGNITTNNNLIDVLNFASTGGGSVTGNIGGIGHTFDLVKIGLGGSATVVGDIFATMTQFQANSALNLADGSEIFGGVDSNITGAGILQFQGDSQITGNIGATHSLAAINLQGANKTVNFLGDVFATSINFTADGVATIADGKNFNGPIITSIANQGTLIFQGSSVVDFSIGADPLKLVNIHGGPGTIVSLNNYIDAVNVTVDNGGTLLVDGVQPINGNLSLTNGSILSLNTNTTLLNVSDDFNLGAGTTYQLNMGNVIAAGAVNATGTAIVDSGAFVQITNAPGVVPGGKAVVTIVTDGAGGGAGLHAIPVQSNSLLTQFSTQVSGNLLQLIITSGGISIANQCATSSLGAALEVLALSGNVSGALGAIVNELGSFTSAGALCQGLSGLAPVVDGGILNESFEMQRESFKVLDERMGKLKYCQSRAGTSNPICGLKGISSGDSLAQDAVWLKGFGRSAHQEKRQGINGYRDTSTGFALGTDFLVTEEFLLGASFGYGNLHFNNVERGAITQANSFQEMVYGAYNFNNPFYLNWALGLAYNDYQSSRNVFFGGLGLVPLSELHGWQTGMQVELEYNIEGPNYRFIPVMSLFYSHLALSGYTETNSNTANQQIGASDFDMLLAGLGLKFVYDYPYQHILYQPEVHLIGYYDFVGDPMAFTSQFVGGGPNFQVIGFTPAQGSLNMGGSINAFTPLGLIFTATLDWNVKEDYSAYSGNVKVRYEW